MNNRRIYLAGPFFNPAEIALIERAEELLDTHSRAHVFSPRKDGGNANRQGDVKANVADIFQANINAMRECTECIAILDRPLPNGWEIHMVEKRHAVESVCLHSVRGPLEQPDLGTVWELGYLKAWRDIICDLDSPVELPKEWCNHKTLVGFTLKPRAEAGKLNLMVAHCLDIVVHGWDEFADWVRPSTSSLAVESFRQLGRATKWMGGVQ